MKGNTIKACNKIINVEREHIHREDLCGVHLCSLELLNQHMEQVSRTSGINAPGVNNQF